MAGDRKQSDLAKDVEAWSDEAAIRFPVEEDRTRQEFAEETDVNVILRRFGAGGFESRPVSYGVQDMNLDLQGVYESVRFADEAWEKLPAHLRKKYPAWPELLDAMERGEATLVDPDGVVVPPPVRDPVGDPVAVS